MLADIARRRQGIVQTSEAIACGFAQSTISGRVAAGLWQRVHRGVLYLGVGPVPREARWIAAVLAVGPRAVLSGEACGEHLGLLRWRARRIEVTTDSSGGRSHRRITVRHVRSLPPADRFVHRGIRTLTPARSVIDLARMVDSYDLVGVIDRAFRFHGVDVDTIEQQGAVLRNAPGHAELVFAIEQHRANSLGVRSRFEVQLARAIIAAGMPAPHLNVILESPRGPFMFDLWWPRYGCVVEVDDHGHGQAPRRADDARRELGALEAGWDLVRVHNEAVDQMLEAVLDRIEMLLRRNGWRGTRTA